jgi:hypothetical protein
MTDLIEKDPSHDGILDLIKFMETSKYIFDDIYYDIMKNIDFTKMYNKILKRELYMFDCEYIYELYNYIITYYIVNFIRGKDNPIFKFYEVKFLPLLHDILTFNYFNVKKKITLSIIYFNKRDNNIFIKYFEDNGLFYLLARINPIDVEILLPTKYYGYIETANYIYVKLMDLRWTWLSAIYKENNIEIIHKCKKKKC